MVLKNTFKYRAKDLSGRWVYGYVVYDSTFNAYVLVDEDGLIKVIELCTLSVCTDFKDKEGVYMYENDRVRFIFDGEIKESYITFDKWGGFRVSFESYDETYNFRLNEIMALDRCFEVIGNKFDN